MVTHSVRTNVHGLHKYYLVYFYNHLVKEGNLDTIHLQTSSLLSKVLTHKGLFQWC